MSDCAEDLRLVVEQVTPQLLALSDEASALPRATGKWSPRQVIGHLVDSASNNHQRFVRAQFQDDLVFAGYDQDAWVEVQQYQRVPWVELVALWRAFNLHLAHVISVADQAKRLQTRRRHNLHQIAWQPVPEEQATTLEYFMRDYVGHLEHHLRQVLGAESGLIDERSS